MLAELAVYRKLQHQRQWSTPNRESRGVVASVPGSQKQMLNPRASNDTGHIFRYNRLVGSEILAQFFINPRQRVKRRPSLCQTVLGRKIIW